MSAAALAWIEAREPRPPETLIARLREALGSAGEHVPEALAAAGLELLERTAPRAGERSREAALDLLAADALLTYACEAAAEAGPDALDALTFRCGQVLLPQIEAA